MPLRTLSAVFFYSALEVFSFFVLLSAFELSFFLLSADFSSVSFMELARWVKSGSFVYLYQSCHTAGTVNADTVTDSQFDTGISVKRCGCLIPALGMSVQQLHRDLRICRKHDASCIKRVRCDWRKQDQRP